MAFNLNDLASFVRVAEFGTISAAAAAEGVPKSTISRRIVRLEDQLGVELLRRSARSFTLTDDGRTLHARSVGAVRELGDAADSLSEGADTPKGTLVVTAPHDLGTAPAVMDTLAEFRTRFPSVDIEVRLVDRLVDLVAEGVDIGLRAHGTATVPADAVLMSRNLGTFEAGLYANPAYLVRHGTPTEPGELAGHDLIAHAAIQGRPVRLEARDGRRAELELGSAPIVGNSMNLIAGLVGRGAGVGLLPRFLAEDAIRAGDMTRLLPDWSVLAGGLTLLWPASRHLAPRVRAFVELAGERLRAERWLGA